MEVGSLYDMRKYMSELSGISPYKEVVFENTQQSGFSYRNRFVLNGVEIGPLAKVFRKGGIQVLTNNEHVSGFAAVGDLPLDTKFDKIYRRVLRDIDEFGIKYTHAGDYKDCLGGGAYSMVPRFRVNDRFFAAMECSETHIYSVFNEL